MPGLDQVDATAGPIDLAPGRWVGVPDDPDAQTRVVIPAMPDATGGVKEAKRPRAKARKTTFEAMKL